MLLADLKHLSRVKFLTKRRCIFESCSFHTLKKIITVDNSFKVDQLLS